MDKNERNKDYQFNSNVDKSHRFWPLFLKASVITFIVSIFFTAASVLQESSCDNFCKLALNTVVLWTGQVIVFFMLYPSITWFQNIDKDDQSRFLRGLKFFILNKPSDKMKHLTSRDAYEILCDVLLTLVEISFFVLAILFPVCQTTKWYASIAFSLLFIVVARIFGFIKFIALNNKVEAKFLSNAATISAAILAVTVPTIISLLT